MIDLACNYRRVIVDANSEIRAVVRRGSHGHSMLVT